MNAAEHIVEAYFRYCESCFTITDRKVKKGNNRQLDLLAYNVRNGRQFHVETGVTHRENWCPALDVLVEKFQKKFFGVPPKRTGATEGRTDSERGKSYFPQINATYREMGFNPSKLNAFGFVGSFEIIPMI